MNTWCPVDLKIRYGDLIDIEGYAAVPMTFTVDRILVPIRDESALNGWRLDERVQNPPYEKDYDAIPDTHPTDWPEHFDTSVWRLVSAWRGSVLVGGAVLVQGSPEIDMLEGRDDLAVLWDLRVAPTERRTGVGSALLHGIEELARARSCSELKVETQNINAAACRFYGSCGFVLTAVNEHEYPDLPEEIQLIWNKRL